MREILFRGKNVETGQWHYGLHVKRPTHVSIVCCIQEENLDTFMVDEKTISQYTGLKDKNGVYIYENDILRYSERQLDGSDKIIDGVVLFGEGSFAVDQCPLDTWLYDSVKGNIQLVEVEVVGNVFDNPELLKEE